MIDASSAIPGYSATDVDGLLSSFNRVVFSTALDMARFGLFISQGASWDGAESPLSSQFYDAMISPSQSLNPSYGYLWWLNGQDFFPFPASGLADPDVHTHKGNEGIGIAVGALMEGRG